MINLKGMKMKKMMFTLLCGLGIGFLSGCACNPGYYAPPYKATIIGCVPAFVPSR